MWISCDKQIASGERNCCDESSFRNQVGPMSVDGIGKGERFEAEEPGRRLSYSEPGHGSGDTENEEGRGL